MKNIKAIALLVLAVVTGLAAAVFAASWVAQRGNIASTKVVTAAVDIEASPPDGEPVALVLFGTNQAAPAQIADRQGVRRT